MLYRATVLYNNVFFSDLREARAEMSQTQLSEEDDDDYDDYDSYYQEDCFDMDTAVACGDNASMSAVDPESFDYKLLNTEDVERLLNEGVAQLQSQLDVSVLPASVFDKGG